MLVPHTSHLFLAGEAAHSVNGNRIRWSFCLLAFTQTNFPGKQLLSIYSVLLFGFAPQAPTHVHIWDLAGRQPVKLKML